MTKKKNELIELNNIRQIKTNNGLNISEKIYLIFILSLFILTIFIPYNKSILVLGAIFTISLASFINLKIYQSNNPFETNSLWKKTITLIFIPIVILALYVITGINQNIEKVIFDNTIFYKLNELNIYLGTKISLKENIFEFLSLISLFCICVQLLIIPKTLYYLNKLLSYGTLLVFIYTILGLIQKAINLKTPFFTLGNTTNEFFFYFAYDGNWAAFAILWSVTSYALATIEYRKAEKPFIETSAPLYLAISTVIASTSIILESNIPAAILSFSYCYICIEQIRYFNPSKEIIFKKIRPYFILIFIISLLNGLNKLITNKENFEILNYTKESAWQIFIDNPIFGWGINSFGFLSNFYNDVNLSGLQFENCPTGILELLVSFGAIGTFLIAAYFYYIYTDAISPNKRNEFSNILLNGLFIIIIFSFFYNPFSNLEIIISFWIIGLCASKWSNLIFVNTVTLALNDEIQEEGHLRNAPIISSPKKESFK